jgi:hypothetical protein
MALSNWHTLVGTANPPAITCTDRELIRRGVF